MTSFDIPHQRLHNQGVSAAKFSQPEEVVNWLCAVQAQDFAGAKWALGLRMLPTSDDVIERAFNEGSILRTHLLRPTWHFVTPADIRWLLALSAPRVHQANAAMYRRLELDRETLKYAHAVLAQALQDGKQRTRDELRAALETAGIPAGDGLRAAYILMSAELDGLICSGPRRGKQFTYALLEERAPHARSLAHEEALAELARRYFHSRGPATAQDFAKWSGLTLTDARQGLEAVKDQLDREIWAGQEYWFPPSPPARKVQSPGAYLLSIYDEYISSYKDRRAIGEAEIGDKLVALGNALSYLIIVDGQIVGTWRRTIKKDAVTIEMNLFRNLTADEEQAVAAAAQRYGAFHRLPVVLA